MITHPATVEKKKVQLCSTAAAVVCVKAAGGSMCQVVYHLFCCAAESLLVMTSMGFERRTYATMSRIVIGSIPTFNQNLQSSFCQNGGIPPRAPRSTHPPTHQLPTESRMPFLWVWTRHLQLPLLPRSKDARNPRIC